MATATSPRRRLTISIGDTGVEITNLTSKTDGGDVIVDEDDLSDGSDTTPESTTGGRHLHHLRARRRQRPDHRGQAIITGGVFTAPASPRPSATPWR
jgi:hypothetical protein